jgi:hypothetical protein
VYSKQQEQLAGTNGLESFREAFRTRSRLVVVLYRNGWGETPWTRIEQTAITDRCLAEGWDSLLFVMLDDAVNPPKWLPTSNIRLSFPQYGFEQLLGAIKLRAQTLGSTPILETAYTRAERLKRDTDLRNQRLQLLEKEGRTAVEREYKAVVSVVARTIGDTQSQFSTDEVQAMFGRDEVLTLRAKNVSINAYLYITYPLTEARIVVQYWKGRLSFSGGGYIGREPVVISAKRHYFDYQAAYGWCWRAEASTSQPQTSPQLADELVKELFELQDRFDRGEIRWTDNEGS